MSMKFPNQKVIGDHVSFTHKAGARAECDNSERYVHYKRIYVEVLVPGGPHHAVITGCKPIFTGRIFRGDEDESSCLVNAKAVWVYTARQGMSNAEIYLPTSGPNIPKITCCGPKCVPFRHQNVVPWTLSDDEKAFLREKAAQQPRVRGRFVKR